MKKQIDTVSLFSGIGAFEKAAERLGINLNLKAYCEINKWASTAYSAIHKTDESMNMGDISEVKTENVPDCDLITHGSPCQDFSVAGKNKGGNKGSNTRSSLMWLTINIIRNKKPKYVIWENVKGVLFKKHKHNFDKYIKEMESLGYNNYYQVLNAKDYGIPQNRERIYVISIRKDIDDKSFEFPKTFDNGLRLKDLLEDKVDEKYYIDTTKTKNLIKQLEEKDASQDISYCIDANYFKGTNLKGYLEKKRRQLVIEDTEVRPCLTPERKKIRQKGRRAKNDGEPMFTITATDRHGVILNKCQKIMTIPKDIINDNERQRRVYSPEGVSPAVLSRSDSAKILQIGMLDMKGSEQVRRVYNPNGIAPTLDTMQGGHRQPKILCKDKNELIFLGGITDKDWAGDGKSLSRNYPQGERVYSVKGIACSQTAQGGGTGSYTGLYAQEEKKAVTVDKSIKPSAAKNFEREKDDIGKSNKDIYQCKCDSGWQDNKVGLMLSPTLRAGNSHTSVLDNSLKIRKLTPLECWRLMGFDDEDYWSAREALEKKYYNGRDRSNSQMYKMAGNSIVVNVLEEIYKKLFKDYM